MVNIGNQQVINAIALKDFLIIQKIKLLNVEVLIFIFKFIYNFKNKNVTKNAKLAQETLKIVSNAQIIDLILHFVSLNKDFTILSQKNKYQNVIQPAKLAQMAKMMIVKHVMNQENLMMVLVYVKMDILKMMENAKVVLINAVHQDVLNQKIIVIIVLEKEEINHIVNVQVVILMIKKVIVRVFFYLFLFYLVCDSKCNTCKDQDGECETCSENRV